MCDVCWKLRPDWLPEPRKESRLCMDKTSTNSCTTAAAGSGVDGGSISVVEHCEQSASQDSGCGSLDFLPLDDPFCTETETKAECISTVDNNFLKQTVLTSEAQVSCESVAGSSSMKENNTEQPPRARDVLSASISDACMSCLSRPKDASIIHGTTGHQACCYACARRLQKRKMPCPICRRQISRVVRNFIV